MRRWDVRLHRNAKRVFKKYRDNIIFEKRAWAPDAAGSFI